MAPNILSIAHWQRLLSGELYAPHSRVDWATLLRRTFHLVTDAAAIARLFGALRRARDLPVAA